jgi:alpha-galactosidase
VKVCTKETHTHDPANSNWSNSVDGLNALVEFSRREYPNVMWENNGDGGTMSTFSALRHYYTFSSCDACEHMPRRQAVYGMSYVFPPRYIDRYMEEPPIPFTTRSSMFGGPWILMQRITEWSPQQIEFVRREAAIYKSLRGLIREGKVFHLTDRPDGYRIEAIESFHPEQNRGVVFVYRPDSSANQTTVYPRGLRPEGMYQVSFQESRTFLSASGAQLMAQGIRVSLPTKNFAEIVYINGY